MSQLNHWHKKLAYGDQAADEVAEALRGRGSVVIDLTKLPAAQRRGVDYLIDDEYIDIKAQTYSARSVFLELECGEQLGCFFKSRADAWLYYFTRDRKLFRLDLPRLQHHIARNLDKYQVREAVSARGAYTWKAVGAIVPTQDLLDLGIAQDVSDVLTPPNDEKDEAVV